MYNGRTLGTQIIIDNKFDELFINKKLKLCLKEMNMIDMTPIQAKCIPHLLEGKDLLGAAKTGSGKTLAFLVPLIEKILKDALTPDIGTLAIILSPTRELSMQTFKVLEELIAGTTLRAGVVIGGNNRDEEVSYLTRGVNILVATPGRLLDHLCSTKTFTYTNMHTLVIDEADRLMHQGFLEDMRAILRKLPQQRQTVLFSATLNITASKLKKKMKVVEPVEAKKKKSSTEDKVLTLACLSLRDTCVCVDMSMKDLTSKSDNKSDTSTVAQLTQKYIICDSDERFRILYTLIQNTKNKKVMVFMATCAEVQFYYKLLKFIGASDSASESDNAPILALHGQQKQRRREEMFDRFKLEEHVTLLCTDIAARGLDIPLVDLVVQYDPPDDHKEYIHRVGRTARAGQSGEALIFLRSHEMDFLALLREQKIPVTCQQVDTASVRPIQTALERIIASVQELRQMAEDAFKTVVTAYLNNPIKCFNIGQLDLKSLAKNFGLAHPPHMVLKSRKMAATSIKGPQKRKGPMSGAHSLSKLSKQ